MILQLHGFASAGEGDKAALLRSAFPGSTVVSPTLPVDPMPAVETLRRLTAPTTGGRVPVVVGTSLGGFYALLANAWFGCPAVVVNPALTPHQTLRRYLGANVNFSTGETFELTEGHLESLQRLAADLDRIDESRIAVLVALDDDVISPQPALDRFKRAHSVQSFSNAGHRFDQFDQVVPVVREFLAIAC